MKHKIAPRSPRALAPFFAAAALLATPAIAQDTPQSSPPTTTPPTTTPPVNIAPPPSPTVTLPPVVPTIVPSTDAPAPPVADAAPSARPVHRVTSRRVREASSSAAHASTTVHHAAPVPVAATPKPTAPTAPIAAAPVKATPAAAPVAAPLDQPAPVVPDASSSQTRTTTSFPLWAWAVGGLAGLAILFGALFALRRHREDYEHDEPAYADPLTGPVALEPAVEPVPVSAAKREEPVVVATPRKAAKAPRRAAAIEAIEPAIAAPDEVHLSEPLAEEVAALTAGAAPATERPWLEFAMRPVRAGTNVDEALVEIELTVGNSGSVSAKDVRISTFLLSGDTRGEEMERLLIKPPSDATTDPVTIEPGEGTRIDATLALLKSDMGDNLPASFRPVVFADARYTMADGSEGRTSASFLVGVTPETGKNLEPIELSRSSMHENVGAELQGQPEHA